MARNRRHVRSKLLAATVCLVFVAGGCADEEPQATDTETPAPTASESPTTGTSPSEPPAEPTYVVEGMYDVGGHKLFIRCEGSGSPTVVYMHGSIKEAAIVAHANGTGIMRLLAPDYRTCVYDRRNVGDSDTVDAVQLPADALKEMQTLLDEAGIEPRYVLLGASFGGMLAYLYANEHPKDVVGMVLLDAMFPDELSLEHLFKPEDTYEAYSKDDEARGLERISHFKVLTSGQPFIGHEPKIPVTYLRSTLEGYDTNDYGIPEFDRQILKVQAACVHRFSPGNVIAVDAPHFMEPVVPDEIADAVRDVIQKAS